MGLLLEPAERHAGGQAGGVSGGGAATCEAGECLGVALRSIVPEGRWRDAGEQGSKGEALRGGQGSMSIGLQNRWRDAGERRPAGQAEGIPETHGSYLSLSLTP